MQLGVEKEDRSLSWMWLHPAVCLVANGYIHVGMVASIALFGSHWMHPCKETIMNGCVQVCMVVSSDRLNEPMDATMCTWLHPHPENKATWMQPGKLVASTYTKNWTHGCIHARWLHPLDASTRGGCIHILEMDTSTSFGCIHQPWAGCIHGQLDMSIANKWMHPACNSKASVRLYLIKV